MTNREEKIRLLKGIHDGTRSIDELINEELDYENVSFEQFKTLGHICRRLKKPTLYPDDPDLTDDERAFFKSLPIKESIPGIVRSPNLNHLSIEELEELYNIYKPK